MSTWKLRRAVPVLVVGLGLALTGPSLAAQEEGHRSAEAHIAEGVALLKAGSFNEARSEFNAAVKRDPQSVKAYVFLGITENELGNFSAAISDFRSALRLDPYSAAAHYNLALSLLRLQKEDEALQELEEVVRLNPKFESAQYNLGVLLAQKGRYKESIQYLEAARGDRPDDPAVLLHLATAYFRTQERDRALQLARKGINSDSQGGLSARLGAVLVDEGYYEEAVSALEKARSYAPESAAIGSYLAKAYLGTDRPAKAIALLERFRKGQSSWELEYLLGLAYMADGQPGPALSSLREAVRLNPDNADIHYNLGKLLLDSSGKAVQKSAAEEIERAISLEPRHISYYITLGKWLLESHRLDGAIDLLKRGVSNVSPSPDLYLMLGLAEIQLNGSAAAQPFVEKAIALNPETGPAWHLLGACYLRAGDYTKAAKYFKKATELSPQDGLYFYDVALTLERLNKTAEAVPYAERSVRLSPNLGIYSYLLGKLYAKLGRNTEAIKEFERCIRLDPKIDYAYYLLARTYMQMGMLNEAQIWSRKFENLKEAKNRAVGLAPPASALLGTTDPFIPTSGPLDTRPLQAHH